MKLLKTLFFLSLLGMTITVHALDQDVKVDLLMSKLITSLKSENWGDAIPLFGELESMEPTMKKPLPENYYFFYIDTLDKTGDKVKAISRADSYLSMYGKKGKHYQEVIEIMGRLQLQVAKESEVKAKADREADERRAREKQEAAEMAKKTAAYEKAMAVYKEQYGNFQECRNSREEGEGICDGTTFSGDFSSADKRAFIERCKVRKRAELKEWFGVSSCESLRPEEPVKPK